MGDFDNVLCYAYDLHDKDLMRLRDEISKEIQKREKKRELEAAERVVKAIQDYLAAGYTLLVEGEVEAEDEDYNPSFRTLEGVIEEVHLKGDEVVLSFCEAY